MSFLVKGTVRDMDTGDALGNVRVLVMDKDLYFDDRLGEATTRMDGTFYVDCYKPANRELLAERPDVYLVVETAQGQPLATTADDVRADVEGEVNIDVAVPHAALVQVGLADPLPTAWMDEIAPEAAKKFTTWTWRTDADTTNAMAAELRSELAQSTSLLEFMKDIMDALKGNPDNEAPPFQKLEQLFSLGLTPEALEGHFYGLPIGIKTGDWRGPAAACANLLNFLYGRLVADVCPWVGKSLTPMSPARRDALTERHLDVDMVARAGINHFNRMDLRPVNLASFHVLSWWMGQKDASAADRTTYGHEKNGGCFVAYRAPSVYRDSPREVLQLNYRWRNLENPPPFRWLIDELVQVAEGFYLGQLLFATGHLFSGFDPAAPVAQSHYQHFGYFVLFDERWNAEARRLFPHLDIPGGAPGVHPTAVGGDPGKYRRLTLAESPPATGNDAVMAEIRSELERAPSLLHLLKRYSDELQTRFDNESPLFLRLQELFHRGIGIGTLGGHFRGALVTWHSAGLAQFFGVNTLNIAWMRIGSTFSTWTGKTFEPIATQKLGHFTDGWEHGDIPTFWGSNTQALRTPRERFVGHLMKIANVWSEEVPPPEARAFGYDLKNFFFIAHKAQSVHPANARKEIFQFNYRWPKLKTIVPDCYCLDELVQIAEGLYLGQLLYATELLKPYDPRVAPEEYRYRHFGYFLLLDDDWHRLRLDIGFDLENI